MVEYLSRTLIKLGIENKRFSISDDLKKITYIPLNRTEKFTDPEEASFIAQYYEKIIDLIQNQLKHQNAVNA